MAATMTGAASLAGAWTNFDVKSESMLRYHRGEITAEDFVLPEEHHIKVPHNKYEDIRDIPVISFSDLATNDKNSRDEVIEKLLAAAAEWGFFGVEDHGVPPEVVQRVEDRGHEFFALPMEQKVKGGRDKKLLYGYSPGSPGVMADKWWTEALQLEWNPDQITECLKRIYPEERDYEQFSAELVEYITVVGALGHQILELLAEGVGLSPTRINHHIRRGTRSSIRINYYPPCPIPDKVWGLCPHSDPHLLSILHQDNVGGLQILRDGKWVGIRPKAGTFVCNIGDMLSVISNGRFPSVVHRAVVNANLPRMSIVCNCNPCDDDLVTPAEELIDRDHPANFEPFTWFDYRANALRPNRLDWYRTDQTRNPHYMTK